MYSLHRYMTICLVRARSAVLFLETMSSGFTPKCSETTLIISSGVISFCLSGEMMSFKASSASSKEGFTLFNLEKAIILLKAPSSSRMLDLMLVAI